MLLCSALLLHFSSVVRTSVTLWSADTALNQPVLCWVRRRNRREMMRQDTLLNLSDLLGCLVHIIPGLALPPHALLFCGSSYYYLDSVRCSFVQNSRALGSSTFSSKLGFIFYCLGISAGCCHLSQVPIIIFHPPCYFFHRKARKKDIFSKVSLLAGFHAQTLIIALPGKGKELFLECPTVACKDFPPSPFLLIKAQLLTALGSLWVKLVCNVNYLEFMS